MLNKLKQMTIAAFFVAIAAKNTSAQETKGVARVNKVNGIEAYIMCEPLREYEVLFDVGTGLKATSIVTGGLVNEGVSDKAEQFVKKAVKEADSKNLQIDAIVYTNGKKVVAVKFKSAGTAETKGLGRVAKINGSEIYVMSEPLREYVVVNDKSGGFKMKSAMTGGVVNNSIEEDVEQFVKRIQKDAAGDHKEIDAVIYNSGKSAVGVKFKN